VPHLRSAAVAGLVEVLQGVTTRRERQTRIEVPAVATVPTHPGADQSSCQRRARMPEPVWGPAGRGASSHGLVGIADSAWMGRARFKEPRELPPAANVRRARLRSQLFRQNHRMPCSRTLSLSHAASGQGYRHERWSQCCTSCRCDGHAQTEPSSRGGVAHSNHATCLKKLPQMHAECALTVAGRHRFAGQAETWRLFWCASEGGWPDMSLPGAHWRNHRRCETWRPQSAQSGSARGELPPDLYE
jgi:hypothetical protein